MGMIPNGGGAYLSPIEYDPSKVNLAKTYYLNSDVGNHWFFLGTWTSFDAAMCHITVYSGDGYNAEPRQEADICNFCRARSVFLSSLKKSPNQDYSDGVPGHHIYHSDSQSVHRQHYVWFPRLILREPLHPACRNSDCHYTNPQFASQYG